MKDSLTTIVGEEHMRRDFPGRPKHSLVSSLGRHALPSWQNTKIPLDILANWSYYKLASWSC